MTRYGAGVSVARLKGDNLRNLLAIHENTLTPDGAVVALTETLVLAGHAMEEVPDHRRDELHHIGLDQFIPKLYAANVQLARVVGLSEQDMLDIAAPK